MPGMTGIDFLEQAMDIAPGAKRVLLTAYADTDAAIRAINDVDLDRTCSSRGTRRRSGCTRRSTSC
jgi:DNA-binding NarL/FixJ family response regulator